MTEKKTVILDSQILTAFMRCEREYDFKFLQLLNPVDKDENLDSGSLFHVMLKIYYVLKRSMKFAHDDCTKLAVEISGTMIPKLELDVHTAMELQEHFKLYATNYAHDSWIPIHVEEPFSFILYEDDSIRIIYMGIMDLVVENYGQTFPVDHKTERRKSDPMELDNQFMGYCAALDVNVLYVNKIGLQKTLPATERYRRIPISYTRNQITEWKEIAAYYGQKYALAHLDHEFPPRFPSCLRYGKKCQYYQLCKTDPEARDWKAQSMFTKGKEWNPFERDAELDEILKELVESR